MNDHRRMTALDAAVASPQATSASRESPASSAKTPTSTADADQLADLERWLADMLARDTATIDFKATLHNTHRTVEREIAQHVLLSLAMRLARRPSWSTTPSVHLMTTDHGDGIAFAISPAEWATTQSFTDAVEQAPEASSARNRASLVRLVESIGGWLRAVGEASSEALILWLPDKNLATGPNTADRARTPGQRRRDLF